MSFCADDTQWTFVGDKTLQGKEAVRQWMATTYIEPPKFMVANSGRRDAEGEKTAKLIRETGAECLYVH
ncbi:hypothetical protein LC607_32110 [Nostoc sp. CHAB 5824]|nr:hypothetical protein [Nostoc sp. CHAB 5824]